MKKVILTGGCGFIGFHMIKKLILEKYKVLNIDFLGYASSKKDLNYKKNYYFKRINLTNFKGIREELISFRPDLIMHFAAESHVDNSIKKPDSFIKSNIEATFNLLEIIRSDLPKLKKFIHVSTDEVFGSLNFKSKKKFNEFSRYSPNSPYSATKAASDHLVRAWGNTYKIPYVITNCSNNFGPRQYFEKLIPVIIFSCINNKRIPIYGSGENIRDWIYVEDHCEALLKIMKYGKIYNQYTIGGGNLISNINLTYMICKILDKIFPNKFELDSYSELISFVKDRPGHDERYSVNSKKIEKELNWKPKFKFIDSLQSTIKWYLNHKNYWKIK